VHGPAQWLRFEYEANADWKSSFKKLYAWRGAGVGVERWWHPRERRNEEALIYTVALKTRKRVKRVEALGDVPESLQWTGRYFVDTHADGSRTIYWRTKLIDCDKTTGKVKQKLAQRSFRLR